MAKVVWTEGALHDLDEIADYIAEDNPDAANRLVRRVFDRVELLETFPEIGRWVPEFPERVHRELVVPPCRVVYRWQRGAVFIELVIRGERLMREQLLKRNS